MSVVNLSLKNSGIHVNFEFKHNVQTVDCMYMKIPLCIVTNKKQVGISVLGCGRICRDGLSLPDLTVLRFWNFK